MNETRGSIEYFEGVIKVTYYHQRGCAYINGQSRPIHCSRKLAKKFSKDPSLIPNFYDARTQRRKMPRAENIRRLLYYEYGVVRCYVCGKNMEYSEATLEHIIPLSKGGNSKLKNLSLSHEECNRIRGNEI